MRLETEKGQTGSELYFWRVSLAAPQQKGGGLAGSRETSEGTTGAVPLKHDGCLDQSVWDAGRWAVQQSGHIGRQNQPHTECKASPYSHPLGFKDVFLTVHGLPLKGPDLFSVYCQLAHSSWKKSPLFLEGGHIHGIPSTLLLWTCVFWVLVGFCLLVLCFWVEPRCQHGVIHTLPTQASSLYHVGTCMFPWRPVWTLPAPLLVVHRVPCCVLSCKVCITFLCAFIPSACRWRCLSSPCFLPLPLHGGPRSFHVALCPAPLL